MIKTFKYRIKDSASSKHLNRMAKSINFVWNYCNDTSRQYIIKRGKWLSNYDLHNITSGCSKDLGIHCHSIQFVCKEYVLKRDQFKKLKLSWRSKKSLGWIPFRKDCIKYIGNDSLKYQKKIFKFWKSREIEGKIKCGSFNQDSKGHWYVNFICEVEKPQRIKDNRSVGIDLGLKTIATLSNGSTLNRENITNKYAAKLAIAQRAKKKRHVTAIHAKIKNVRKDWNHKQTTYLVNSYGQIFIGNVNSSKLKKTKLAKSVSDAGWYDFKTMLEYKAITLGVDYKEVNESFSTVTCSTCFERSGPSGLSALGVREWTCSNCGTTHNRDVNAARNILRFGCQTPIKGALKKETSTTRSY